MIYISCTVLEREVDDIEETAMSYEILRDNMLEEKIWLLRQTKITQFN